MWKISRSAVKPILSESFIYDNVPKSLYAVSVTESAKSSKPMKAIPGPSVLTVIRRNIPGGKYCDMGPIELQEDLIKEYGPVTSVPSMLSSAAMVLITDPNDFELIFRTEGPWPYRRAFEVSRHHRKEVRPEKFNNVGGLMGEHEEGWYKLRSTINPAMLRPATVNSYIPQVDYVANQFCDHIRCVRDEKNEMPAKFIFDINKWAMESISMLALDTHLNLLRDDVPNNDPRPREFIHSLEEFITLSVDLEYRPSLWKYIATPKYKRIIKAMDKFSDIVLSYVDDARVRLENRSIKDKDKEDSVLEKLLKVDRIYAVSMALDMILAGVDTTSTTVSNVMYFLAKNQDKQDKLRSEVLKVPTDENGRLTPSSFRNIPYLRACIKESMRMTPTVSANVRRAGQDLDIKGYHIPKGTDLTMTTALVGRNELFFQRPNEYIPERFLKASHPDACPDLGCTHPFSQIPFGFGPRSCVGQRFAEMEMFTLFTRLLRQYRLEYDYEPLKYRQAIVLAPASDLKFKFIDI